MNEPAFVRNGAFNWTSLGYSYQLDEPELQAMERGDRSPWFQIARIVAQAKAGDFSRVGELMDLVRPDARSNFAPTALLVLGDLGRPADLAHLTKWMVDGPDGLRVYACQGARNAGCVGLVPHMLRAWNLSESVDAHEQIAYAIADLLDAVDDLEEEGPIAELGGRFDVILGNERLDPRLNELVLKRGQSDFNAAFNARVLARHEAVQALCADGTTSVWGGEPVSVMGFAQRFLAMISPPRYNALQSPLTVAWREKFEASTGVDCSGFFHQGRLRQGQALSVLEGFLSSSVATRYLVGKRYFFGHEVS